MITEFSKAVCIPELVILDRDKRQDIADARELYWFILQKNGFSRSEIARLCNRTYATVISGVRRVNRLLEAKDAKMIRLHELTKEIERYADKSAVNNHCIMVKCKECGYGYCLRCEMGVCPRCGCKHC